MLKHIFSTIFICIALYASSQISTLDSGLVLYLPFNGSFGDSSGLNNTVNNFGATLTKDRFENPSSAYYFNGTSNKMVIPNNSNINFNTSMSICFWMKPQGFYAGRCYGNCIIGKGISDYSWLNQGNYLVRFGDLVNGCNPSLADSTTEQFQSELIGVQSMYIQKQRWYFVAVTTDSIQQTFYINGEMRAIVPFPANKNYTNPHDLFIGAWNDSQYPYYFKGVLDDMRLYNRKLSTVEVRALYNQAPYPSISGDVFVDKNNDGQYNGNDYPKPNVRIDLSNGSFAITDNFGMYQFETDNIGTFTSTINAPRLYKALPSSVNYNFIHYTDNTYTEFALQDTAAPTDSLTIIVNALYANARPGFDYPISVNLKNDGNTFINANFNLPYDTTVLIFKGSSSPQVINNNGVLSIPNYNYAPGEIIKFSSNFSVKTTATLGKRLVLRGSLTSSTLNLIDSSVVVVTGSFDPNDKSATEVLNTNQVKLGKPIKYTIRFENTGTDTAFTVIIRDTLNPMLNANSLELLSSSHNCNVVVKGKNVSFTFKNILLPDSNVDKINCHGYVTFMVRPLKTLSNGVTITNKASIYFDYNLPIVTNTAKTKILSPIVTPLQFLNYSIKKANSRNTEQKLSIQQSWTTTNEINVSHFNMQRSFDAVNFKNIASIKANNGIKNNYEFLDDKLTGILNVNTVYYRIEVIDNDGSVYYSETRTFNIESLSNQVKIYPNPAQEFINISTYNNAIQSAVLTDLSGNQISTIRLNNRDQKVNISFLKPGIYLIKFDNGFVGKVVKK